MERFYRVFRYRSNDEQHGAPGTGVTIKDDIRSADYAEAYRDGYLAACVACGWDDYDRHCGCNPTGEVWVFPYESYPVVMCRDCGSYVPNWYRSKEGNRFAWCANCVDRLIEGMGARMDAMAKQHGPYITTWPQGWDE